MNYDGLLLASGGMDSTILAYDLLSKGKNMLLLFIDYGQHCVEKEYETLLQLAPNEYKSSISRISISDVYKHSQSRMIKEADLWSENVTANDLYLPYRNTILLSIAAAHAQTLSINSIYAAFINSNHAKEIDCSAEFFAVLEKMLFETGSVKLNMPYREMSKKEVAEIGIKLQIPFTRTFSCQVNSKTPCGACPNCVDRLDALNSIFEGNSR